MSRLDPHHRRLRPTDRTYPLLKPLWDAASKRFAQGAENAVNVFHSMSRGVRVQSVWRQVEYPELVKRGVDIIYHAAP
jgi:hypothetical protein